MRKAPEAKIQMDESIAKSPFFCHSAIGRKAIGLDLASRYGPLDCAQDGKRALTARADKNKSGATAPT